MEETARSIKEGNLCWYVVYTLSKAEKKVEERLQNMGLETYLPLHTVARLWNNRKKQLTKPVIPGCIFVHIPMQEAAKVSATPGVSFILKEEGRLASISNEQMDTFRRLVENEKEMIEFAPADFQPGISVRVVRGELKGIKGELVDCQGRNKLLLRIEGLGCALVTVSPNNIEKY